MAITFAVSNVVRATARLIDPAKTDGESPRRQLHGRTVEAWGSDAQQFLPAEEHGLLKTVHRAYADHYPLVLTPDAIWLCIAQGFAIHVKENAERLRGKFVRHEGQERLVVVRDHFVKGSPDNDWPGVFGEFSAQIAAHIGRQRDLVVCDFSTTGPVERAASEIVLMDALQHYFTYELWTMCGIPEITLEGAVDDWISIRRRVRALGEYELSWWTRALEPVLDQFVAAARGHADVRFWEVMFKQIGGSGGPYVNGWINVLFPYLRVDGSDAFTRNDAAVRWERGGSDPDDWSSHGAHRFLIPSGISTAPLLWHYLGSKLDMELLAGFVGTAQDKDGLALRPAIGWAVRDAGQTADVVQVSAPDSGSLDDVEPDSARFAWTALPTWLSTLLERGSATVLAGRMARRGELTGRDLERAALRTETLRKEADARLVCVPAGDISQASRFPDTPVPCRLFVGVASGSVTLLGSWTQAIEAPARTLAAARALAASVWDSLDEVVPGGLSEETAVYLVLTGESLRSAVFYGEQDPRYHTSLNWPLTDWGWGAVAAEVASSASTFAVLDASPDAHAQRVATAESLGVEASAAAYHLAMDWVSPGKSGG
uniref:DUF4419 domain-containing protein n=1 Tax=Sorangium cellulosum TaxID=56 RepID=A0A3S7UU27_SORCE|nr:hypothetical protein [Sorangium cellulosum]